MNKLNHIAFIMDGNGRWGKKRNRGRNFGHINGVKTVKKIVEASVILKIPIVTFYVFSTENWKRPKSEINFLFQLITNYFKTELKMVMSKGIKINIIGDIRKLPSKIKDTLNYTIKLTKNNKKITVNLAINYGAKDEIIRAANKINKVIDKKKLANNLYTKNICDPDILVRTGGHKRLSNFMLWQLAYSEIYFLDKLWPDFNGVDLNKIVKNFKR